MMMERNPHTGQRITNIFELRSLKMKSFYDVALLAKNCILIKYEQLMEDTERIINNISESFRICLLDQSNIKYSVIPNEPYQIYDNVHECPMLKKEITSNIDWGIENKIGYYEQRGK